jgi:hypothetical protein
MKILIAAVIIIAITNIMQSIQLDALETRLEVLEAK